jgi:3-hydroxybutyryl-CoA dehydrogenase
MKRISTTTDPELAAKDADIISESVPEKPGLKVKVFSQFNQLCPECTVFTTNTSTLMPSMIAEATGRPDRFLALHYHDVNTTNVVDIMPHPGTSKETIQLVKDFALQTGQLPIMMEKEHAGYVFNFMLSSLFTAALSLKIKNVASIEDIDRAWMGITHMMAGPFGLMDSIGLDTMLSVTEYLAEKNNDDYMRKHAQFIRSYVERGHLGKKSGKGFYDYPQPAFTQPEFLKVSNRGRDNMIVDFSLKGKVAVVTGASRGIGESIAKALAEYGAEVIITNKTMEGLPEVKETIRGAGGKAVAKACHNGILADIDALFKFIESTYGRLDILVNNAAMNFYFGGIIDASETYGTRLWMLT